MNIMYDNDTQSVGDTCYLEIDILEPITAIENQLSA